MMHVKCAGRSQNPAHVGVASLLHPPDVLQKINRPMLAARAVLDEARNEAVLRISRDNQSWDFGLTERLERLEPPLAANEIIERPFRLNPPSDGDWLLEADLGDVVDNVAERLLVANARINNIDPVDRDHLDPLGRLCTGHAAALSAARAVSR